MKRLPWSKWVRFLVSVWPVETGDVPEGGDPAGSEVAGGDVGAGEADEDL